MNEVKVKVWTGTEMLGPFDLSQNPEYWANKMQDGKILLYTGLKDADGKEIYEGDFVEAGGLTHKVEYAEEYAGFLPFVNDGGCGCCSDISTYFPHECKVIGNIYENPKLLKEEAE